MLHLSNYVNFSSDEKLLARWGVVRLNLPLKVTKRIGDGKLLMTLAFLTEKAYPNCVKIGTRSIEA